MKEKPTLISSPRSAITTEMTWALRQLSAVLIDIAKESMTQKNTIASLDREEQRCNMIPGLQKGSKSVNDSLTHKLRICD
ncbi:hypothetical protein ACFLWX_00295 [Chloroflexota bacterium]